MIKKIPILILISIILTVLYLSGCEQKGTNVDSKYDKIILDSSVVKLAYSSLNYSRSAAGDIVRVDVEYLFKNIANKPVDVQVFVKFYDKNDNLLATEGPKEINLPEGYTEQVISPANIISYKGKDAAKVDHVTITAKEKT